MHYVAWINSYAWHELILIICSMSKFLYVAWVNSKVLYVVWAVLQREKSTAWKNSLILF